MTRRFDISDRLHAQQNRATNLPEHLKRPDSSKTKYEKEVEERRNFRSETGMPTRYVPPQRPADNIIDYKLGGSPVPVKSGGK